MFINSLSDLRHGEEETIEFLMKNALRRNMIVI